jgi:hypothetical protein
MTKTREEVVRELVDDHFHDSVHVTHDHLSLEMFALEVFDAGWCEAIEEAAELVEGWACAIDPNEHIPEKIRSLKRTDP